MKNPDKPVPFTPVTEAANRYRVVGFISSVNGFEQLLPDVGWEVAFAGRSNAGKSSALNLLTDQRQLARVSKTPGRTQMINFFRVEADRYLVDLPGYGYAQVPEAMRRHWGALLERYLRERQALRGLLLLMDIRHPLTPLDQRMLDCCIARELPVHILLTKADKLSRGAAQSTLQQVRKALRTAYPQATLQLFSATTRQGVEAAHAQMDAWLGY
ncbi:MAG: YihA family ribosome biogenesis GTP-binding protein [Gammaproteobacteria bacterium]|nr:YihA family ribosome biogenesis GTP-binding protein [Gammaproteobacteria bacterium]MCP5198321.1 YihA family ribosome biogenesis GTP-binding protein [Gammaproteobacteria bacterium]